MPPNRVTDPRQKRKRHRSSPLPSKKLRPKKYAVNPLKSRIRDLERQLSRMERLPADLHVAKERELAALKHELADTGREKNRSEMVKKYHMVRFFDRRKAERRLKKLEKLLRDGNTDGGQQHGNDTEEREAKRRKLEEQVLRARVDLSYAIYAPLTWKYCALFPKRKDDEGDALDKSEEDGGEKWSRGDPVMWERVKKAMEEGKQTLEALRESTTRSVDEAECGDARKTTFTTRPSKKDRFGQKQPTNQNRNITIQTWSNSQVHESKDGDDNVSDGGFFE